jgi:hypothetical protein
VLGHCRENTTQELEPIKNKLSFLWILAFFFLDPDTQIIEKRNE